MAGLKVQRGEAARRTTPSQPQRALPARRTSRIGSRHRSICPEGGNAYQPRASLWEPHARELVCSEGTPHREGAEEDETLARAPHPSVHGSESTNRRPRRHCSWGRWPRFSHLALRPHPSRQWLRIRFGESGHLLKRRSEARGYAAFLQNAGLFFRVDSQGLHSGLVCDAPTGHGATVMANHSVGPTPRPSPVTPTPVVRKKAKAENRPHPVTKSKRLVRVDRL